MEEYEPDFCTRCQRYAFLYPITYGKKECQRCCSKNSECKSEPKDLCFKCIEKMQDRTECPLTWNTYAATIAVCKLEVSPRKLGPKQLETPKPKIGRTVSFENYTSARLEEHYRNRIILSDGEKSPRSRVLSSSSRLP
jgi:hypothetical protein